MTPADFLRAILPSDGYYALVGIKNKKVSQVLVQDLDEVEKLSRSAVAFQSDFYFGCASFNTSKSRKRDNVLYAKSFWVDLDCGVGTAYETKQQGFDALKTLCKETKLPRPWVVDSGRGLHVYWVLEQPLLVNVWQVYAEKLIQLAAEHGLFIKDPGCSTDIARILRIPGTKNFKNPEEPLDVAVLCTGAISPWATLKDQIESACGEKGINGFHDTEPPSLLPRLPRAALDPVTAALVGNQVNSFKKILRRIVDGTGCAQIAYAVQNQADVKEPLWRAALSIAQVCEDRDVAIHQISKGHPDYTPAATERKANETNGPMTCAAIERTCGVELCEGCSHQGKIVGPITLSKEIAAADPEVPVLIEIAPAIEDAPAPKLISANGMQLPDLPYPYYRGTAGGIYIRGREGEEPKLLYEHSLDVVRRIKDPEKGEVLIVLHDRPKDGLEEIVIPLADAQSLERMKDKLSYHGVAAHKEQMNQIGIYMTRAVKNLQCSVSAEPAHSQMGWTEDRQGIVWGRTLITKEGPVYCPPASKSTTVANMMTSAGSFERWESITERYAAPGFELHAACILMAFGSLLSPYTYEDPVWIHLVSSESGTGKTTLTNVINSIWGDPFAMKLTVMDTINALEKRRVVFNHFAICQDEITNLPPEKLSHIAYAQSQGREKLRLRSNSDELVNIDKRCNIFFSNGNKFISDALGTFKTNAAGEFARLIEIPFMALKNVVGGDDHFGKILKNYGHAGPRFAKWLVEHESELQTRVNKKRAQFAKEFESVSSERNWVAATAAGFAAAEILQGELGILKAFDLEHIYARWVRHMGKIRQATAQSIVLHDHLLGEFINENYANIIIPDAHVMETAAKSPETASLYGRKNERDARNKLVIRWEKNTRMLFIAQHELKTYCMRRAHSYADLLDYYSANKQFVGVTSKRLGAGTGIVSSPIKALTFHVDDAGLEDTLNGE